MTEITESIALFDYSHAVSVAFHGAGPEQTTDTVIAQLRALRSSCGRVIVCLDTKPYFRTQLFDGYKAGRKSDPDLLNIWDRTLDLVVAEGYATARAPGAEADDCMATLANIYAGEYGCQDVRLVTADKDVAQCLNDNVRWFVPQLGKRDEFEIRTAEWVPRFFGGVEWEKEKQQKVGPLPSEIPLCQAICGDTSDRIPGVKGIGIKGAVALIKTYGTLEAMAQGLLAETNAAKMKGKELAKFWQHYAAGMADIPKWLSLTTLRTDVEFDVHPLKFLERVEPKPLSKPLPAVPQAEISDADDSAFYDKTGEDWPTEDIDWAAIEKATAERERAELAKALPVDSQRSAADRQVAAARAITITGQTGMLVTESELVPSTPAPRVGKDPNADAVLEQAARERATAAANTTLPKDAPKGAKPTAAQIDATQAEIKAGNEAERARPKDAPAAQQQTAPAGPVATGAAEVVPKTQGPQSTALAVAPPRWELQVQPKTVDGMMWMAERLHAARVFSAFGSVEGTFGIIAFGRELGMGVMQSLMSFVPVKEKPFMWAHAMRGRVLASPVCEYLINTESTSERSTWITRRVGWPAGVQSSYTFTFQEAAQIGLTTGSNRENWNKNPRSMVDKTASSRLIRQVYADVLLGIHSIEESA
jgi:5'-3' exonuclease